MVIHRVFQVSTSELRNERLRSAPSRTHDAWVESTIIQLLSTSGTFLGNGVLLNFFVENC